MGRLAVVARPLPRRPARGTVVAEDLAAAEAVVPARTAGESVTLPPHTVASLRENGYKAMHSEKIRGERDGGAVAGWLGALRLERRRAQAQQPGQLNEIMIGIRRCAGWNWQWQSLAIDAAASLNRSASGS